MEIELKARELKLLEYLAQITGCDIWGYGDAIDGRSLQRHGLVDIGEAQKPSRNGAERQPYYGICINDRGRDWIAKSGLYQRGLGAA